MQQPQSGRRRHGRRPERRACCAGRRGRGPRAAASYAVRDAGQRRASRPGRAPRAGEDVPAGGQGRRPRGNSPSREGDHSSHVSHACWQKQVVWSKCVPVACCAYAYRYACMHTHACAFVHKVTELVELWVGRGPPSLPLAIELCGSASACATRHASPPAKSQTQTCVTRQCGPARPGSRQRTDTRRARRLPERWFRWQPQHALHFVPRLALGLG